MIASASCANCCELSTYDGPKSAHSIKLTLHLKLHLKHEHHSDHCRGRTAQSPRQVLHIVGIRSKIATAIFICKTIATLLEFPYGIQLCIHHGVWGYSTNLSSGIMIQRKMDRDSEFLDASRPSTHNRTGIQTRRLSLRSLCRGGLYSRSCKVVGVSFGALWQGV